MSTDSPPSRDTDDLFPHDPATIFTRLLSTIPRSWADPPTTSPAPILNRIFGLENDVEILENAVKALRIQTVASRNQATIRQCKIDRENLRDIFWKLCKDVGENGKVEDKESLNAIARQLDGLRVEIDRLHRDMQDMSYLSRASGTSGTQNGSGASS